jgi:phosphate transport system permease protein
MAAGAQPVGTGGALAALADDAPALAQPPSAGQRAWNTVFLALCRACAWLSIALVTYIVLKIAVAAAPAIRERGLDFLTGRQWDPNQRVFGILPEIWGTLYTSVLALALGSAFGVATAIFLSEGFLAQGVFAVLRALKLQDRPAWSAMPDRVEDLLRNLIELLAAIPSVVYGLWGLYVVIPMVRPACNWLHVKLGWIPFFGTTLSGPGVLPAVLVLSIMILPTVTALGRDSLVAVPSKLRMAAYGMGATRWETITAVILPTAARGIFGAVVLAFGRALGETMALAMLVGNANKISVSLFSPANTLSALLANGFPEAGRRDVGVLMYAALVLLGITLVVNVVGELILQRASRDLEAAR